MAPLGGLLKKRIRAEATCDVCEDFYADPVILRCGSSFCRACVAERSPAACPDCGAPFDPRRLTANHSLAHIVEIAKQLLEQEERREASALRGAGGEQRPEKSFFCKEEKTLLCPTCYLPEEHRDHDVVLAELAAREYKFHIRKCLIHLKKEEKDILSNKTTLEVDCQYFFGRTTAAWEKTRTEFQRMEEFLEKQKRELLAQVMQVYEEIQINKNEQISALFKKQSFLQDVIYEMEEASQLSVGELLENIGDILRKFDAREMAQPMGTLSPDLQSKILSLVDTHMFLLGSMKHFRENVASGLSRHKGITTPNPNGSNPSVGTSEEPQSVSILEQAQLSDPGEFWPSV